MCVCAVYLVLPHAVAGVEDDTVTHQVVVIRRVVVKTVVGHSLVPQLEGDTHEENS